MYALLIAAGANPFRLSSQIAYNSLLAAYTKQGLISKVEAIFDDLQRAGFEPSKHTYATVINAYG